MVKYVPSKFCTPILLKTLIQIYLEKVRDDTDDYSIEEIKEWAATNFRVSRPIAEWTKAHIEGITGSKNDTVTLKPESLVDITITLMGMFEDGDYGQAEVRAILEMVKTSGVDAVTSVLDKLAKRSKSASNDDDDDDEEENDTDEDDTYVPTVGDIVQLHNHDDSNLGTVEKVDHKTEKAYVKWDYKEEPKGWYVYEALDYVRSKSDYPYKEGDIVFYPHGGKQRKAKVVSISPKSAKLMDLQFKTYIVRGLGTLMPYKSK